MGDIGDLPTRRAFTPVMPVLTLGQAGAKEKLPSIPIPFHPTGRGPYQVCFQDFFAFVPLLLQCSSRGQSRMALR
jgi:hypothetical protein